GIGRSLIVGHAAAVPRKRDHRWDARFGSDRYVLAECLLNGSVVLCAVEGARDLATAGVSHGADQPIAAWRGVLFGLKQVDASQSDLGSIRRELIERGALIAPAAH